MALKLNQAANSTSVTRVHPNLEALAVATAMAVTGREVISQVATAEAVVVEEEGMVVTVEVAEVEGAIAEVVAEEEVEATAEVAGAVDVEEENDIKLLIGL